MGAATLERQQKHRDSSECQLKVQYPGIQFGKTFFSDLAKNLLEGGLQAKSRPFKRTEVILARIN